jgi:hypothetical protein
MERAQDVDDLKERIAKVVARAHSLYERSLAIMDRATSQIDQSSRLLWHRKELLQRSRLRTPSPRSSSLTAANRIPRVLCSRREEVSWLDTTRFGVFVSSHRA